ncbi:MAG: hypothetical protein LAT83_21250 [Kiritimatiellae bacterium]|nr:hypothetical protein [Kiritimatiellia bacterium]
MLKHFDREVEKLHRHLIAQTDRICHNARIVLLFDAAAGDYIDDKTIDRSEVEIEEDCLKIIALHQPVADDLRFLTTIIKTNYNFERMGDLLENLHDLHLNTEQIDQDLGGTPGVYAKFLANVEASVRQASMSLAKRDGLLAREIWKNNKLMDREAYAMVDAFRARLLDAPATPALLDGLLSIRYAKRIADNAANVAKEMLYLQSGEIVRHRSKEILG